MTKITKFSKPQTQDGNIDCKELNEELKAAIDKFESKNKYIEVNFVLTTRTTSKGIVVYPFFNGTEP